MTTALPGPDDAITPLLRPGERVLWRGSPDPWRGSLVTILAGLPFWVVWTGFAIFWESTAINAGAPASFLLWGVPFLALGLYNLGGRIPVDVRTARATTYAVTNRRVIAVRSGLRPRTLEVELLDVISVASESRLTGLGTIRFNPRASFGGSLSGIPLAVLERLPASHVQSLLPVLEAIPEVEQVEDIIDNAIAAQRSAYGNPIA